MWSYCDVIIKIFRTNILSSFVVLVCSKVLVSGSKVRCAFKIVDLIKKLGQWRFCNQMSIGDWN